MKYLLVITLLLYNFSTYAAIEEKHHNKNNIKAIEQTCLIISEDFSSISKYNNEQLEKMIIVCKKKKQDNPLNQTVRFCLAVLYESIGQRDNAISELKKISIIDNTTLISLRSRKLLNTLEFLKTIY